MDAQFFTYQDLAEYCAAQRHGGSRTLEQVDIKTAIQGAYTDVGVMAKDWPYYETEYRINLATAYSAGTVQFDLTGDAAGERALILTGGTWPSWIAYGRIRINDVVYKVDRVSADADTILLDETFCPTADIAGGTSYLAYQTAYPLPSNLLALDDLFIEEGSWLSQYIPPWQWLQQERFTLGTGQSWAWTLLPDTKHIGRWVVMVHPIPSQADPLAFFYRRRPRTLRYSGSEAAARVTTATGSAAAYTLTTATTLPQAMAGAVIRLGSSEYPTGLAGVNPFVEQHEIRSIASTTVTLKTPLGQAFAAVKAVVTDPIDMSETMVEALKARIEYRMSRMYGEGKDRTSPNTMLALADREMRLAMERDCRVRQIERMPCVPFAVWAGRVGVVTE